MSGLILTEEELQDIQKSALLGGHLHLVINSHRELFKANAGLSHENFKYKQFLKKLQHEFYVAGDYNNLDKINTFMEDAI